MYFLFIITYAIILTIALCIVGQTENKTLRSISDLMVTKECDRYHKTRNYVFFFEYECNF